jgi:hypothetical protein
MIAWPAPKKSRIFTHLILFILAAALVGCGPSNHAVRPDKIQPDSMVTLKSHPGRVVIDVDGGWEKAILGLQLMPNDVVMAALKAAIEQSGLFEDIASDGQGDYYLLAFIYDIDQPLMGATGTVTLEMAWSLTEIKTGAVIWRESIETTHTTPPQAAFNLRKKSNMAAEEATKENIRIALERISGLRL